MKEDSEDDGNSTRWKSQSSHLGGAQHCQEDVDRQYRRSHQP